MEKINVAMSTREYKRFLAYKEAYRVARQIKRGLREMQEAHSNNRSLKSAYELANEL